MVIVMYSGFVSGLVSFGIGVENTSPLMCAFVALSLVRCVFIDCLLGNVLDCEVLFTKQSRWLCCRSLGADE